MIAVWYSIWADTYCQMRVLPVIRKPGRWDGAGRERRWLLSNAFRVIALDLDGTLFRSDLTVSARTMEAVRACHADGARVIIATARPPRSVRARLPEGFPASAWVCFNGASVYIDGRKVARMHIDPEPARRVLDAIYAVTRDAAVSVESGDALYCDREIDYPWQYEVVDLYTVLDAPVPKINLDASRIPEIDRVRSGIPSECRMCVTGDGTFGEVMNASASKLWGIEALLGRWGLGRGDVIAFGDEANDLEMITHCGIGVAMGNAIPELKSAADYVTWSNDEDGIAEALERL